MIFRVVMETKTTRFCLAKQQTKSVLVSSYISKRHRYFGKKLTNVSEFRVFLLNDMKSKNSIFNEILNFDNEFVLRDEN